MLSVPSTTKVFYHLFLYIPFKSDVSICFIQNSETAIETLPVKNLLLLFHCAIQHIVIWIFLLLFATIESIFIHRSSRLSLEIFTIKVLPRYSLFLASCLYCPLAWWFSRTLQSNLWCLGYIRISLLLDRICTGLEKQFPIIGCISELVTGFGLHRCRISFKI